MGSSGPRRVPRRLWARATPRRGARSAVALCSARRPGGEADPHCRDGHSARPRRRTEVSDEPPDARARRVPPGRAFRPPRQTRYLGDGERVFCHPLKGSPLDHKRYADTFRDALERAGVADYVRPFHDGAPLRDHERRRGRQQRARGDAQGRSLRLPGDADVPRPRGRRVRRGGQARSGPSFRPCASGKSSGNTGAWIARNPSRGDRTRTCNPRFWRPVRYQLRHAPGLRGECSPTLRVTLCHEDAALRARGALRGDLGVPRARRGVGCAVGRPCVGRRLRSRRRGALDGGSRPTNLAKPTGKAGQADRMS